MISLRTKGGLNLEYVEKGWGKGKRSQLEKGLKQFVDQHLVQNIGTNYCLTDQGMLRADGIAAALFSPLPPSGGT
jgi:oxygen-independent coproporphyrinogen-3 oxidase